MSFEFALPDVGEGIAEGELVRWLVDVGDRVEADQPLAEVETDKAVVEIPSPVSGTVVERRYEEGEDIPVGETFVVIDIDGEPAGDGADAEGTTDDGGAGRRQVDGDVGGTEPTAEPADSERPSDKPATEVGPPTGEQTFSPPSVRRLARELGVDIASVRGTDAGGRITERDVRAAAGADVAEAVGEPDGRREDRSGGAQSETVGGGPADRSPDSTSTQPIETADRDRTITRPSTRRLAAELGVDIDVVPADEEYEGKPFVTREAVRAFAERQGASTAEAASREAAPGETATRGGPGDAETRVPYRGVRSTIGERMTRSKFTIPHATYVDEADVTELVRVRAQLDEHTDVRLTYMPFVLKAVAAALAEFPYMNAELDEAADEIVLKHHYDLGVATATDRGLLVPVLDAVDEKSLRKLAVELDETVEDARNGGLPPEALRGSTFTVTNFGAIGGQYGTPIINHPEVGILGCGAIVDRARVVFEDDAASRSDGGKWAPFRGAEIVPRKIMGLSLSVDHRVIDGATAAEFTSRVKELLEDPTLLLTV